jgi:hypothetical protein
MPMAAIFTPCSRLGIARPQSAAVFGVRMATITFSSAPLPIVPISGQCGNLAGLNHKTPSKPLQLTNGPMSSEKYTASPVDVNELYDSLMCLSLVGPYATQVPSLHIRDSCVALPFQHSEIARCAQFHDPGCSWSACQRSGHGTLLLDADDHAGSLFRLRTCTRLLRVSENARFRR